jgi:DinB superfamily
MNERYPIGTFHHEGEITSHVIKGWINDIEKLPLQLADAVVDLNDEQLDTPYRFGGWSVRQVVHHLADSHMNAFIRFKLAVTEDTPVIKTYEEGRWAKLADSKLPIDSSLTLLHALHKRWVELLNNLTPPDLKRTFIHPESGEISIEKNIGVYAWHGKHHLAHITSLTKRKSW